MINASDIHKHNKVGPVISRGELADVIIDALQDDNPDKEFVIEGRASYIRVQTDHECILRGSTISSILGRPFKMQELQTILISFSGQIEAEEDFIRFYFNKIV